MEYSKGGRKALQKKQIAWNDVSLDIPKLTTSRRAGQSASVSGDSDVGGAFFLLTLSQLTRLLPLVLLLVLTFGCATTQNAVPKETYYPVVAKSIQYGDADSAIRQLSGIPEGERDTKYYMLLGQAYFKKGNYPLAIENFKKSLEKDSSNENAKYGLAVVYIEMGRYDLAEKYLMELLKSQRPEVRSEAKAKLDLIKKRKGK